MNSIPLNTRIDRNIIDQAKKTSQEMGIPFSALISGLLMKVIREKKVEFSSVTENGFTDMFENRVLESAQSKKDELILESDQDILNYFKSIKK